MLMLTLVGERQACGHRGGLIETARVPTHPSGCLRRLARAARRWLVRPCSSIMVHADNSDEKLATRCVFRQGSGRARPALPERDRPAIACGHDQVTAGRTAQCGVHKRRCCTAASLVLRSLCWSRRRPPLCRALLGSRRVGRVGRGVGLPTRGVVG